MRGGGGLEEDTSDSEPSLGSSEGVASQLGWERGQRHHREQDAGDKGEPNADEEQWASPSLRNVCSNLVSGEG